jgi:radical SAM protein with 4Fe4S-binding SPASM domain
MSVTGSEWASNQPFALQIEITSHCNLRCKMCPLTGKNSSSSLRPGHISEVLWDEIVPLAREVGHVIIAGFGEPLTNPKCLPLLRQLDACGIRTSIATNGILLHPGICAELSRLPHLTHINVSIDSPDPVIYRQIRGGELERALDGLRNLMGCIDDPNRVTVSSVIMRSTVAGLADFPSLLARYGVRQYILQGLQEYNAVYTEEVGIPKDGLVSSIDKIREACRAHSVRLAFSLPHRLGLELADPAHADLLYQRKPPGVEKETRQCHLPWELPYIDKDGRVFPCCIAAAKGTGQWGRLSEERLPEIWDGANARQFRVDILDGRTTPAVCQDCKAAPLGEHLFRLYSARIVTRDSVFDTAPRFKLVVQNTGTISWEQGDLIRIGTCTPRDRLSACAHSSWLSRNRIGSFQERTVRPGENATFVFEINPLDEGERELFQLVAEGRFWFPYTRFSITPWVQASRSHHGQPQVFETALTEEVAHL